MILSRVYWLLAIAVWVLLVLVAAADGGDPLPESLEQRLIADTRDGALDEFSLLEAALIGSGVAGEEELSRRSADFAAIAHQLRAACAEQSAEERVRSIFHFAHQRFLTGRYEADCSNLRRTLDEGCFNCVTATILFHCLCDHAGLQPQIIAVPGHVFSRFDLPGIGDVQTTCAEWFPPARPARQEDRPSETERRTITPVQLLGKLYYNTGIARLEARDFERAVSALQLSTQLDAGDLAARDNLLAAINNWSLAEDDAGRMERSAALIVRGLEQEPAYGPLLANDLHIHQKWTLQLCDAGRFEDALQLLERCRARRPDAPLFDAGRVAVVAAWSESLLRQERLPEAFAVMDAWRERCSDSSEAAALEETLVCRAASELLRSGRREAALGAIEMGLHRQPHSERLRRQRRDLTHGGL